MEFFFVTAEGWGSEYLESGRRILRQRDLPDVDRRAKGCPKACRVSGPVGYFLGAGGLLDTRSL